MVRKITRRQVGGSTGVTNVFLILNLLEIHAPEPEVVDTIVRVAGGRLSRDKFAAWIRHVVVPSA